MSLFGMPEGTPCCCQDGCCPGVAIPDCITLELNSSLCPGETATVVLTNINAPSLCDGGEDRPESMAEAYGADADLIWTGAIPEGWCEACEISSVINSGTVNVFCRIDPVTNERSWWIGIADNDLGHTWYPDSTAQYYQLDLISCEPLLLQFGSTPDCDSSCIWTFEAACFVAGTLVKTPTGERPIQLLKEGDEMLDIYGNTVVVFAIVSGEVDVLMELTDEYGVPTGVTPEHPFIALDMESTIEAGKLVAGQRLPLGKTIASVKAFRGTFEVYNLSVSGSNTFVADGYAVHNKGRS